MDKLFPSKLQTTLNNIGRSNGLAPPKSQDPADAILHEFYIADIGKSVFTKRREAALDLLKELDTKGVAAAALRQAEAGMTGSVNLVESENYNSTLTTKQPAERFDKTIAKNELIKLGVDTALINAAFGLATKKNKPAESYAVSVKTT